MQDMKLVRPLSIVVATLVAIGFFYSARVVERRAATVDADPEVITCQQLGDQATPDNRHLKITDCRLSSQHVYQEKRRSSDWEYVYVPLYSRQVEREENTSIRLLVRFTRVRSEQELDALREKSEFVGCIWDDHTIRADMRGAILDHFPQIDLEKCRVVHVGEPLPTPAAAQLDRWFGYLASAVAIGMALWIIVGFVQSQLGMVTRPSEHDAFVENPTRLETTTSSSSSDMLLDVAIRVGMYLSPASIVGAIACYGLMELGLISAELGGAGSLGGMVVFFVSSGVTLFLLGRYREYAYELLSEDQLPRGARRNFLQKTPELERMGFEYLGDVKLTKGGGIIVRQFLSQDSRSLAFLEAGYGMQAHSLLSITSDGVCLETASVDNTELNSSLPKRRNAVKGSLETAYHAHEDFVLKHVTRQGVNVLTIDPEQIPALMDYEHRVSAWSMYKSGWFKTAPPSIPVFESMKQLKDERDVRVRRTQDYDLAT